MLLSEGVFVSLVVILVLMYRSFAVTRARTLWLWAAHIALLEYQHSGGRRLELHGSKSIRDLLFFDCFRNWAVSLFMLGATMPDEMVKYPQVAEWVLALAKQADDAGRVTFDSFKEEEE